MFDRARTKAVADCKAASAPAYGAAPRPTPASGPRPSRTKAAPSLVVSLRRFRTRPGAGVILLGDVAGKRDRWTGTRAVQMTIDSFSEPLRLDLKTQDAELTAGVKHTERWIRVAG